MPTEIFLHEHKEFADLIGIVARDKKIDPYLVEKDYWLMHCLYGLKKAGYDFQLKGGTSLSKGYGIIHRFSEDIDIHITPPAGLKVKTGRNHDEEKDRQSRKEYYDYLAGNIEIPGILKVDRDTKFDSLPKYFSGGIRLYYDTKFPSDGSAKEGILLEVGFDDITPNKLLDIDSWALRSALDRKTAVIDNTAMQIPCYDPGYTLVEKLQAIVTKYRNQQALGDEFPPNFMRHYYDIFCLLQNDHVQAFIGSKEYQAHKERRFPKADQDTPLNQNEALLMKEKNKRALYKKEYERRASLYYQGQPSFDSILEVIKKNLARL